VFSQALNESKKQNHGLLERLQAVQAELASGEARRAELELQSRQTHKVYIISTSQLYTIIVHMNTGAVIS